MTKKEEKFFNKAKENGNEWYEKYTNSKMYNSKFWSRFLLISRKELSLNKEQLIERLNKKYFKKGFEELNDLSIGELFYILYKIKKGQAGGVAAVVVVAT